MGNCNIEKGQPSYANYSKEQIEEHCVAMIKKDHFIKREPVLKNQALEDVQKIIDASMDLIGSKEEQMIVDYNKQIKRLNKDEKKMRKLEKSNINIEDYVKLTEAKEKFTKYSLAVEYKLNNIKAELEINMNMTFQGIKENIENKAIYFEEQEAAQREDLEEFFYKWRLINREKMKDAIIEIENEFRDGLTHDYFRNKLKNVVSADEIRQLTKRKPVAVSVSQIEPNEQIMDKEVNVQTTKGWLCCMPAK